MKPETTLKEVLKPPFKMNGLFLLIADQHRKSNKAASKITKFIEASVDERWRKVFGEPLRWKYFYHECDDEYFMSYECEFIHRFQCGSCDFEKIYPDAEYDGYMPSIKAYRYCPSCGVRLLPPREDK